MDKENSIDNRKITFGDLLLLYFRTFEDKPTNDEILLEMNEIGDFDDWLKAYRYSRDLSMSRRGVIDLYRDFARESLDKSIKLARSVWQWSKLYDSIIDAGEKTYALKRMKEYFGKY